MQKNLFRYVFWGGTLVVCTTQCSIWTQYFASLCFPVVVRWTPSVLKNIGLAICPLQKLGCSLSHVSNSLILAVLILWMRIFWTQRRELLPRGALGKRGFSQTRASVLLLTCVSNCCNSTAICLQGLRPCLPWNMTSLLPTTIRILWYWAKGNFPKASLMDPICAPGIHTIWIETGMCECLHLDFKYKSILLVWDEPAIKMRSHALLTASWTKPTLPVTLLLSFKALWYGGQA